jgi:hypothetical protein
MEASFKVLFTILGFYTYENLSNHTVTLSGQSTLVQGDGTLKRLTHEMDLALEPEDIHIQF